MPQVESQRLQVVYWPVEKLIPFARNPNMVQSGNIVVRQIDLSEEQILRPEKCRACPLNESSCANTISPSL